MRLRGKPAMTGGVILSSILAISLFSLMSSAGELSILLGILLVAILVKITLRKGFGIGIIIAGMGIAIMLPVDSVFALFQPIQASLLSMIIAWGIIHGYTFTRILMIGTGGTLSVLGLQLLLYTNMYGFDVITNRIGALFEEVREAAVQVAASDALMTQYNAALQSLQSTVLVLLPAFCVAAVLAMTYITVMFTGWYLKWSNIFVHCIPKFCALRMSKSTTMVLILAWLARSLVPSFGLPEVVGAALLNIIVIIMAVAAVCGLSVVDFYFSRRLRIRAVRWLLYLCGLFWSMLFGGVVMTVLAGVGIVDSFVRLRVVIIGIEQKSARE